MVTKHSIVQIMKYSIVSGVLFEVTKYSIVQFRKYSIVSAYRI